MSSIKTNFLKGFEKTAGLPKWIHEVEGNKPVAGQSRKGLKGLLKRRGVVVGGLLG